MLMSIPPEFYFVETCFYFAFISLYLLYHVYFCKSMIYILQNGSLFFALKHGVHPGRTFVILTCTLSAQSKQIRPAVKTAGLEAFIRGADAQPRRGLSAFCSKNSIKSITVLRSSAGSPRYVAHNFFSEDSSRRSEWPRR